MHGLLLSILGLTMVGSGEPAFSPAPCGQLLPLAGGLGLGERCCGRSSPATVFPGLKARVAQRAKAKNVDREDPEYKAVLLRQKVLTEAMDVLSKYDEAQADFQSLYSDSNAPLGDWCGYYRRLTAADRAAMRESCKALSSEASYVLIGLNAENLAEARTTMNQWITGLGLPQPDRVPFTDDTLRQEYNNISEMPDELQELFRGPIHMCYNSIAGADEDTGDDAGPNPPALLSMEYRHLEKWKVCIICFTD